MTPLKPHSKVESKWRFRFSGSFSSFSRVYSFLLLCFASLSLFPEIVFVQSQIIIIPKTQVKEPFKNNPKWEHFKTAQFDRIKVLGTLVANVWTFLDSIEHADASYPLQKTFVRYHVNAFVNFFKQSEARLSDGNPYAILDPAIGIHTMESLFKLSNIPPKSNQLHDQLRIKWMELDSMVLSIHLQFNETTRHILEGQSGVEKEVLEGKTKTFPTWISQFSGEPENGTIKRWTLDEISSNVDKYMDELGKENHLIRGLVHLLSSMTQNNVDTRETLNYYCYGNNDFGVFQDIYDVLTDAALYLCMMDMKKLILDIYQITYAKFFQPGSIPDSREERKKLFNEMVEKIKRKIDFEYLEGSDYSELPHPPIFKCDKVPDERGGVPSQWGTNITTGISPPAGATYPYDPQAGPEKEDGNVGYIDDRQPSLEFAQFDKSFHGYLESELVLNPNGMCKGTCSDYKRTTPTCEGKTSNCQEMRETHCDPPGSGCMERNKCPEFAKSCKRTSHMVDMCFSDQPTRYYSHFNIPPDQVFGLGAPNDTKSIPCAGESKRAKERWEMEFGIILNNPQYCELCLCTCLTPQDPTDQHYVDLQPVVSDVTGGFIVSSVRFLQEDRVIRLAIEQGKPLKKGEIDPSTTSWVAVPPADKTDPSKTVPLGVKGFLRMNFDIVVGEAGQVVTGVRFVLSPSDQSLSLQVQIASISWSPADPTQITLNSENQQWIESQKYPDVPRRPLRFYKPNSPAVQKGPSMPDVVYNSYVEFTTTDYEEDIAQSTIPFFDTQPVHYYETKRWLQGVGVMHKGKPGSGGFIAPIVVPSKGNKSNG